MTNSVYINGLDAFETWGIDFEPGAISALLTPPANKAVIENESRLEDGTRAIVVPKKSKRDVSLPFHLLAPTEELFYQRYDAFCEQVLEKGTFTITSSRCPDRAFHLIYNSCQQFTQFRERMALFTLKCTEPNPSDR